MQATLSISSRAINRPRLLIAGMTAVLGALLMVYSQTMSFAWDEGFHLLAAQSILRGKRPYLDFIFSQTPLNSYWNAFWMRLFGDTWRTPHAVAAVMVTLAVVLTADYLLRRFPIPQWRLPSAIVALFVAGLNVAVVQFGTVGQAYGLCLFSMVAAFRLTLLAVERRNLLLPAAAGFFASTAANASLLTAPAGPVLLLLMMICNRRGSRRLKLVVYAAAAVIPAIPLLWLYVHGPRQTLFSVLDYNLRYRLLNWEGAYAHDAEVMLAWIDCAHALALIILAAAGIWFVWKRSGWERTIKAEFYLCFWLAVTEACHIASAHPNFQRYYLFTVPFLTILACAGLYALAGKLAAFDRPFWPVTLLCLLMVLGIGKAVFEGREDETWMDVEKVARKVNEVTPPNAPLLADELTYFVSKHPPYPGNELMDSHKISLPPAEAAKVHLIPKPEMEKLIKAGTFATVVVENDDKRIEELGLKKMYKHSEELGETWIFWDKGS